MRTIEYNCELCVVGGGLAGLCTAISASRHGVKTVLIHDRPVLGGNSSEEVRMWVCGSHGKDNREGGIIEEIQLENFYQNTGLKYSIWDSVLYEKAKAEKNLTLLLNSSVFDADTDAEKIRSVKAWQSNAETFHIVKAGIFADCSGDSILAPLSGAGFMYGREAKSDFGETIPPDIADKKTMGMSCIFQIRETGHPVKFTPPVWAYKYEKHEDLPYKDDRLDDNFWWIEIGGEWDCIHDTDRCRDELLKIAYGVWDHMKNYGDHGAENWELEWIGFLPGKRESRRYIGQHIITQNDVENGGIFSDTVAYAGWSMDDHFPEGFYYKDGYPTIFHPAPQPWGIPYRALISKNIKNLCFAGRNISVTHAALSSSRVMATCAILGQALGTAVSLSVKERCPLDKIDIELLQQTLIRDDCYIPGVEKALSSLTKKARYSHEILRNGKDRGEENCCTLKNSETIEITFENEETVKELCLIFDSDFNRNYHNMPCNYPLKETRYKLPKTLITKFELEIHNKNEEITKETFTNHQRLVKISIDRCVTSIKLIPKETNGSTEFRIFSLYLE